MPHSVSETRSDEPRPEVEHAPHVHRDHSVQDFLDRLAAELTAGRAAEVAAMWETPAMVLGDDIAQAFTTSDELEAFFAPAKERYNQQGVVATRAEIVRQLWPTDRIAIVEVRWPYLDADGDERGYETSTYTLRRDDKGGLKIKIAVMHGATKRDV